MNPAASSGVRLDATREPTFTTASWPKMMPFGLIRKIVPVAVSAPITSLGCASRIRFSATCPLSWLKTTLASTPMSKLSHWISARALFWVTVMVLPVDPIVASPPTTVPPVGSWFGATWATAGPAASASATANVARRVAPARRPAPAPRADVNSEATWSSPRARLRTMR